MLPSVLWVPEVHAPDLLELAALSGTRMVKRKPRAILEVLPDTFSIGCLHRALLPRRNGPDEIITGIHEGHRYNFQSQVLLQFSLDIGSMYKETGLNDANVFSARVTAVFAGIFIFFQAGK